MSTGDERKSPYRAEERFKKCFIQQRTSTRNEKYCDFSHEKIKPNVNYHRLHGTAIYMPISWGGARGQWGGIDGSPMECMGLFIHIHPRCSQGVKHHWISPNYLQVSIGHPLEALGIHSRCERSSLRKVLSDVPSLRFRCLVFFFPWNLPLDDF